MNVSKILRVHILYGLSQNYIVHFAVIQHSANFFMLTKINLSDADIPVGNVFKIIEIKD